MNYGHIGLGLQRQLMAIKTDVAQMRTEWLTSLSDPDLAAVVGPRFAEYFEMLTPEVQYRMGHDKDLCAEVVEAYRDWVEETEA